MIWKTMIKLKHGMSIDHLVNNFRDILGILEVSKPHSFTQFHLLAGGVLATAAGLFVAMRGDGPNRNSVRKTVMNWLSEESSKEEIGSSRTGWISVAGLHNLANNCFLNVVLQVRIRILNNSHGNDFSFTFFWGGGWFWFWLWRKQALASCICFYPYLQDMFNKDDLDFEENNEKMPLTSALVSLLKGTLLLLVIWVEILNLT